MQNANCYFHAGLKNIENIVNEETITSAEVSHSKAKGANGSAGNGTALATNHVAHQNGGILTEQRSRWGGRYNL